MNLYLKAILTLGIVSFLQSTHAGEQRLVGYANGKPLYVNGGPIVRRALPAAPAVAVRAPQRAFNQVHVGSSQCYHGPVAYYNNSASSFGNGYGWGNGGFVDGSIGGFNPNLGYGWGHGGYACNDNSYRLNRLYNLPNLPGATCRPAACPAPYVNPYPAAAAQGYSWIPRYGASSHAPQHP